jgi:glycosyltransferase involved in cell wall biosynthesis
MRVLFLSHLFPNAARPVYGTFVLELARFLAARCKVSVVAPIPYFPLMRRTKQFEGYERIPASCERDGVAVQHPRFLTIPRYLKWLEGISYTVCCLPRCARLVREADVILAHWTFPDGFSGLVWARLMGRKLALVIHGNESIHYFDPDSIRKRLIRFTLARADHIVAVSRDLRDKLVDGYGIAPGRVTVLANGVDLDKFRAVPQEAARTALGLPADRKILLAVARLSPEKRLDLLLRAAARAAGGEPFRLYLVGDGPEEDRLRQLTGELGLEGVVSFVGAVPHAEIHLWMSAADLFCLSSEREGSPVVIGEAFVCGTPVIATRVGGVGDLVADDRLGLLVRPESVDALAEALRVGLATTWDRGYLSSYGLQFGWDIVAARLHEVLSQVARAGTD